MTTTTDAIEVKVPDIGDFSGVPVIEVHVAAGDTVAPEDPLITLESDKATMDVPSPAEGVVQRLAVSVGDEVSEGDLILTLSGDGAAQPAAAEDQQAADVQQQEPSPAEVSGAAAAAEASAQAAPAAAPAPAPAGPSGDGAAAGMPHAGPSVRRLARELGVDLATIRGTGEKGRITKEDLLATLKGPAVPAAAPAAAAGTGIPEIPPQDFSKFGPVETQPLPRIKKISGPFLHRSWLNVPHVTHNDEADITELDAYRKELDTAAKAEGYRVTLLAFLMKAAVSALREFPEVNSSLTPEKDALILKSYYHIGIAVDTPGGLVVPVIRDVDRKGVTALSKELGEVSKRARDGKLTPDDMSGGTFTISSLGGIGGTAFTPIVNAPEVAILGVVRSKMSPVWNGSEFVPRLMLPVSLSYDHRVIDGALAARFVRHLCQLLEDMRRLIL
jgi:pyruvate dehydrogenase E2 component (dihydrolipoyllysine-residue acetyltransferase)